jgi:hypothetical protein
MWRTLIPDGVEITILGRTEKFRFHVKLLNGRLRIDISEGINGHWRKSFPAELDVYLTKVTGFDAVMRHHQGLCWVTTTGYISLLSVLRN